VSERQQPSFREILRTISAIINENSTGEIETTLGLAVAAAIALYFSWRYFSGFAS
jgi:hypothetical protein